MTKKDYVMIARTIQDYIGSIEVGSKEYEHIQCLIGELIVAFKMDNPRFDGLKFITACGLTKEGK